MAALRELRAHALKCLLLSDSVAKVDAIVFHRYSISCP